MHQRALTRLHAMRAHRIGFIEDDLFRSRLPAGSADFVISTFGLKTFNRDQHRRLAELLADVLRPGGVFSMIEASDPRGWLLRPLYRFYMLVCLPLVERLFLRGAQDFTMIGAYTSNFGDASGLAAMLREAGLEVSYRRFFFGCATAVSGRKPLD